jgi:hypothetical protein
MRLGPTIGPRPVIQARNGVVTMLLHHPTGSVTPTSIDPPIPLAAYRMHMASPRIGAATGTAIRGTAAAAETD